MALVALKLLHHLLLLTLHGFQVCFVAAAAALLMLLLLLLR